MSNQTNIQIEYKSLSGSDAPWFVKKIPTMMIVVVNLYHQFDLDNAKKYINAYSPTNDVLHELVEKMMGRDDFRGSSPVDLNIEIPNMNIENE